MRTGIDNYMENGISFIIAVNDEFYFNEACKYINNLEIPKGYSWAIIPVRNAASMCKAYNQAEKISNSKYKVYLHQDVFIINRHFIRDIIEVFKADSKIGMIGMMGASSLPDSGIAIYGFDMGMVAVTEPDMSYYLTDDSGRQGIRDVKAVDGVCIATQYDLPWREDLFTHFDFYDISQSLEYLRKGYRVVVPDMSEPWIIHDCGFAKMDNYMDQGNICRQEYPEYFTEHFEKEYIHNAELAELSHKFSGFVRQFIDAGNWMNAIEVLAQYQQINYKDSEIERLRCICDIYRLNPSGYICSGCCSDSLQHYSEIKFAIRRLECSGHDSEKLIEKLLKEGRINSQELFYITVRVTFDRFACLDRLKDICHRLNLKEYSDYFENNSLKFKDKPVLKAKAMARTE